MHHIMHENISPEREIFLDDKLIFQYCTRRKVNPWAESNPD